MTPAPPALRATVLWRFLLLTWLAVLVNMLGLLARAPWGDPLVGAFTLAVYLTYALGYLVPVFLPLWLLHLVLSVPVIGRLCARLHVPTDALLAGFAIVGTTAVQLLLHADLVIVRMFGFHLNGFVWNLLTTPGGLESLDASESSRISFGLLVAGFLALQSALYWVAARNAWLGRRITRAPGWRRRLALAAIAFVLAASERLTFAVAHMAEYRPLLVAADTFPMYAPTRWRQLGEWLGISKHHDTNLLGMDEDAPIRYPLVPLLRAPDSRDWNVLWLVSESLRADALDAEVMPATWAFAQGAANFQRHYSSGNGTRMGMFGMFYGLYGNAWFQMLAATRGPVVMDVMLDAGYDVQAFTSARFTYPEFDRTLFARVPRERLHEGDPNLPGWENDRGQVAALLESFDARDASRPFFRFMFFESPHAPYNFPPDSVIRPDYLPDLNYVALDLDDPVEPIRDRYINACHHLDSQFARVFAGLEERGLLDSTIVIITGDHGEEFLERGHWGHNSAFTDHQTRTPLVIRVPGHAPAQVARLSSHHDLPATLLALLGVITPSDQFSLGHDLFGGFERSGCVISSWDQMALVEPQHKYVLPFRSGRLAGGEVLGPDDRPLENGHGEVPMNLALVRSTLHDMARFGR